MKQKLSIFLIVMLVISLFSYERIFAEDKTDTYTNTQVADVEDSGYESWYVEPTSPLLREMYGGYNRTGNFYLFNEKTKVLYYATQINCYWQSSGVGQKYLLEDGTWLVRTSDISVREYSEVSGEFTLNRNCTEFSVPIYEDKYKTGNVLPMGTYTVLKQCMDFVQVQKKDGTLVWVIPQYSDEDVFYSTCQGYFVDSISTLSVSSVNGVPIKQMMMPVREDKRTGIAMKPLYVTIHNTGSNGSGANAYAHANNQIYDSRTYISWHYTVDNNEIFQSMPMNEVGFHAGDGLLLGNGATIGIEICENSDGNYAQAEKNAAYLTAQILYENGLPSDAVRMHHDWSGKNCAQNILERTDGSMGWDAFKALVKQEYDRLMAENASNIEINTSIPEGYEAFLVENNLTFEDGYTSGYPLVFSVEELKEGLQSVDEGATIVIYDAKEKEASGQIATGYKVVIQKEDNTSFSFIILLKGDVNGDGYISSKDYNAIKNHINGNKVAKGTTLKAADVNKDGYVSSKDYNAIKNHITGKRSLY